MTTPPCPEWQYGSHSDRSRLLPAAASTLLTGIQAGKYPIRPFAADTRPIHRDLFNGLTPIGFEYYAGNYRGSHHRCLKNYKVMVPGDPLVGTQPSMVEPEMARLGRSIIEWTEKINAALESRARPMTAAQRAVVVIRLACNALVSFLTIHPYADGNGHTGRALVWILLIEFGYVPNAWTVEPTIPGYGQLIARHRRGDREPLEQYVLTRISLAHPPA